MDEQGLSPVGHLHTVGVQELDIVVGDGHGRLGNVGQELRIARKHASCGGSGPVQGAEPAVQLGRAGQGGGVCSVVQLRAQGESAADVVGEPRDRNEGDQAQCGDRSDCP